MNKKLTRGIVSGLIMLTSMSVAFGAGTKFEIKATMDSGVTIKYKDEVQKLVDVNGVTKDPIMYNGTTYVPVRSIGDIVGLDVDWDKETRTVLLDEKITVSLENDSLEDIMSAVYSGVKSDLPMVANTPVTDENVKYFLGIESLNGAEALASEAMIGSIPHSVVLLRAPEGSDIEALKKEIKEKVDPRKWICVGVERDEVIVDNIDNVVIMIIQNRIANEIHESFLNLNNENQ
ncbi:hypothetical protein JYG23_08645 [Sedimentibacter sp. zth1]|uniref:stalk domain-containing protein n=1 Tax=Sedimentibacter sp. zth1 TaxID=2816908 RepID=UPI001A938517|nr:stalk domain-containing protein [Sedimentibacter sp. zth1]QSX04775.1 hypothetical protein JYG23_08645 [Sedimentibacter sp. zth1]